MRNMEDLYFDCDNQIKYVKLPNYVDDAGLVFACWVPEFWLITEKAEDELHSKK